MLEVIPLLLSDYNWSTTIILPRPATIKIPRLGVCDSWFWLLVVFGVVLGGGWVAGVP